MCNTFLKEMASQNNNIFLFTKAGYKRFCDFLMNILKQNQFLDFLLNYFVIIDIECYFTLFMI